jgi:hypothetical protein
MYKNKTFLSLQSLCDPPDSIHEPLKFCAGEQRMATRVKLNLFKFNVVRIVIVDYGSIDYDSHTKAD